MTPNPRMSPIPAPVFPRIFRLTALALVTLGLVACGDESNAPKGGAASAPAASASAPTDASQVVASQDLQQRLKLATVAMAPVAETLDVVGRIDFDEQSLARVGATVTGRISDLLVQPGQRVRSGTVLAQLHSTELGAAQLAYLKARAQRELAASAAERARSLLAADVIGSAEAQRRDNELQVANAEERAAADQLRVMGVSGSAIAGLAQSGRITSTSSVVSTLDGIVVERKVNKGQVVQPADVLFTVAELGRVWVVAQVPEAQAPRVQPGQVLRIEIPSGGIAPIETRVDWVADTVNPETRTVMVRASVDNPKRQLKPAMLAQVRITPQPIDRLVVPSSAVVRENDSDHVFVRTQERTYRLVPVKLGNEVDNQRVVESGVKAGDTVVVEGAFHLNNERNAAALGDS